jgi:hypothetical protein
MDKVLLRNFGLTLAFIFSGIIGFLFPLISDKEILLWPFWVGIPLCLLSLIRPRWLAILYTPWMKIGHLLGFINTRILLSIFFFVFITPMGLALRLLKKDPLKRAYEKDTLSYRKITPSQPIQHMERPF